MNYRTLFHKTYLAFMLVFTVTVVSIVSQSVTVQGSGDPVKGEITSFGYNNPTEISGLSIVNSGTRAVDDDLSRIGEFELNFNVYDIDGFRHLDVYVVLYNDGDSNTDSGVTLDYINSGVRDNALVIRWLAPERSLYLSGLSSTDTFLFDIDSNIDNFLVKSGTTNIGDFYGSGVTDFVRPTDFNAQSGVSWIVYPGSSTETDSGIVSIYDSSGVETSSGNRILRRNVTIPIKMSKVAPSSGDWNYAVYVFDRLQQEISQPNTGIVEPHILRANVDYTNQWYGEIEVLGVAAIEFPTVEAGSGMTPSSGVITARFTSNGNYSQLVSADTTWTPNSQVPGRPLFAYLIPSSGFASGDAVDINSIDTQGNRFALEARRVSIAGGGTEEDYVGVVLPDAAGDLAPANTAAGTYRQARSGTNDAILKSKIVEIATAAGTTEFGVESTFDFRIQLSRVFQTIHFVNGVEQTTIYTGSIQLGIQNSTTASDFFTEFE
jgi:hypothetical protein